MAMTATIKLGLGQALALALACSALAACGSNGTNTVAGGGSSGSSGGPGDMSASGGSSSGDMGSGSSGGTGTSSSGAGSGASSGTSSGIGFSSSGSGSASSGSASSSGASSSGASSSGPGGGSGSSSGSGSSGGAPDAGKTGGSASGSSGGSGGSGEGGAAGCPAGAAFCDDFEASAMLGSAWTIDNTLGATISVVSTYTATPGPTMAHSGKNAVQISFTTGSGYGMLVNKSGFPDAMGIWGRVWMYIETPATDTGHDVYIEGSTGVTLNMYGIRPMNSQKGNLSINQSQMGLSESGPTSTMPVPRGAWTCFEWNISASGASGTLALYVGGAAMPLQSLNSQIPTLVESRLGYERFAPGTAGNLWIDDFAIGSARLGCM